MFWARSSLLWAPVVKSGVLLASSCGAQLYSETWTGLGYNWQWFSYKPLSTTKPLLRYASPRKQYGIDKKFVHFKTRVFPITPFLQFFLTLTVLLLKLRPTTPRQRVHHKFLRLLPVPFYPCIITHPWSIFPRNVSLPPLQPGDFRQRQSERTAAIYTQPLQFWVFCSCLDVAVTAPAFGKIVCSTISNPISAKVEARSFWEENINREPRTDRQTDNCKCISTLKMC